MIPEVLTAGVLAAVAVVFAVAVAPGVAGALLLVCCTIMQTRTTQRQKLAAERVDVVAHDAPW
eukprot:COSAG06_NODE_22_length_33148_cov_102.016279_34_plen_63_part_00